VTSHYHYSLATYESGTRNRLQNARLRRGNTDRSVCFNAMITRRRSSPSRSRRSARHGRFNRYAKPASVGIAVASYEDATGHLPPTTSPDDFKNALSPKFLSDAAFWWTVRAAGRPAEPGSVPEKAQADQNAGRRFPARERAERQRHANRSDGIGRSQGSRRRRGSLSPRRECRNPLELSAGSQSRSISAIASEKTRIKLRQRCQILFDQGVVQPGEWLITLPSK
jgi:hypothetical protein